MPELPEVETVKEILKKQILNKQITNVDIYYDGVIENVSPLMFKQTFIGQKITDILRYGKYLMFILEKHSIVSHLRMEGKYFIKNFSEPIETHEHVVFTFSDNSTLRYHDTRKFGKMVLLETTDFNKIMEYPALKKLGLEANDPILDANYLYQKLKNKKMPIKTALLDQTVIAGLGNIYVDEVCHLCKLHPTTKANTLSLEKCEEIVVASKKTLSKAINEGGTTIRSYTSSLGVTGRFQQHLFVHTRYTCQTCGAKVAKIRVGGRGTYYCPICQPTDKKIIGITGVIGSGKSTVSNYLKENGFEVIDSDLIVKNLYESNELTNAIKYSFGEEFLSEEKVNKAKLGKLVFENKHARQKLNAIVHPLVKKKIEEQIEMTKQKLVFVDVPLLFEARFNEFCDYTIVVYTNELENINRLMMRNNISKDEALLKINSQMPMLQKCYLADFIIDNSSNLCYTYERINRIVELIK